jgi:outer membrane lipoprotein-sorting protein
MQRNTPSLQKKPGEKNTVMSRAARFFSFLLGAIPLLYAASCTLPVVPPPTDTPPPLIGIDDARTITAQLQNGVKTLKGVATIRIRDTGGNVKNSISGFLAVENPDKVRFSSIGPFGVILFEAVINGEVMVLFLPQQMTAYVGEVDTGVDGGMGMGAQNPTHILWAPFAAPLGDEFFIEHQEELSFLYGVSKTDSGWELSERMTIARREKRLVERERFAEGVVISRMRYDEYADMDGIFVPLRLTIDDLIRGETVELLLSKVTLNGTFSADAFDTDVGDPWEVKDLSEFVPPDF